MRHKLLLLKQKSKGGTFVSYPTYFVQLSNIPRDHSFKRSNTNNGKTDQVRLAGSTARGCILKSVLYCLADLHIFYMLAIAFLATQH